MNQKNQVPALFKPPDKGVKKRRNKRRQPVDVQQVCRDVNRKGRKRLYFGGDPDD